jgi:glucan 1,4-alpha-glucosidase
LTTQKFIGVWWEMHVGKGTWEYTGGKHAANTENVKKYIDFAAKYGINGVLVEGWNEGWEDWFGNWKEEVFDFVSPYPDYDIKHLTDYAASKNVKIIMHHETSGSVTNYERRMNDAFDYMNKHGINTVKTGYVGKIIPRGEHHDSQWMTNHYLRVAQKAAEKKIMVVSHESSRPTGLHRTYPNWMASEAARGNEFNNAPTLGINPEHETILAFTRIIGGPMDYTPGFFHFKLNQFDPSRTTQVNTTISKQVAMFVVFYSPIQMLGDLPENLEKHPELVKFIVDIPLEWEATKVLDAEPGDYLIYARKAKKEETWYLAGISDENERTFDLDFSFLDVDKKYTMEIIQDTDKSHFNTNPTALQILHKKVNSRSKLKMNIAPGGGFIIKISPEDK